MLEFRIERREAPSRRARLAVPVIAVAATLLAGLTLFTLLGSPPLAVARSYFVQPFASLYGFGEVLLKMAPLLLLAQGLAIGFRASVWNIGAEGQLIVGACAAAWLA
ncbi:MAG: ABC transporter permease, partial [Pseudomonadota bacterium]